MNNFNPKNFTLTDLCLDDCKNLYEINSENSNFFTKILAYFKKNDKKCLYSHEDFSIVIKDFFHRSNIKEKYDIIFDLNKYKNKVNEICESINQDRDIDQELLQYLLSKVDYILKCYDEFESCFHFYGADFMVTTDYIVKLLEINFLGS